MKILLIGEYSRLHNSLKEGLIANNHEVVLISDGDDFKNYPSDISIKPKFYKTYIGSIVNKLFKFITRKEFYQLEIFFIFWKNLSKMKDFDVVQLINECSIKTFPKLELYLLKKIFKQNKKVFLLCCGQDYKVVNFYLSKTEPYSIMSPYFENKEETKHQYSYFFNYITNNHKAIHEFIYKNMKGVIASDWDYVEPVKNEEKYLGLLPNPINFTKFVFQKPIIDNQIFIFLGINTLNSYPKGIIYFEKALVIIQDKYRESVRIIITKDLPYEVYIQNFNSAHIILDQAFAKDQGMNALEAMAKGKVVFTGANQDFLDYYNLNEDDVCIHAKPDVNYLVEKLSWLIENPNEIIEIGNRARRFIEKEHDYINNSLRYLDLWSKN